MSTISTPLGDSPLQISYVGLQAHPPSSPTFLCSRMRGHLKVTKKREMMADKKSGLGGKRPAVGGPLTVKNSPLGPQPVNMVGGRVL